MSEERDIATITVPRWNKAQVQLLARTVAKGASEDELKMFAYVCKRTALDPFLRQVYWIKRWDPELGDYRGTIQVGIDGLRLAGHRTKRVAGISEPRFEIDAEGKPVLARVSVFMFSENTGEKIEFVGEARMSEYQQKKKDGTPTSMWMKMPHNQLAKCAEAQAWRKAAPAQVSGLVVHEEAVDVEFTVETDHTAGGEATPQASIPSDTPTNGILREFKPSEEMPLKKGEKRAKTRPGYVIIETDGEKNVKLTFFARPEAFTDDSAGVAAAKAGAECQFTVEIKGEYRNLGSFVLKPVEDAGHDQQASAPAGPPSDADTLKADYLAQIEQIVTIEEAGEVMNSILGDKGLAKPLKDDLWKRTKEKRDGLK